MATTSFVFYIITDLPEKSNAQIRIFDRRNLTKAGSVGIIVRQPEKRRGAM